MEQLSPILNQVTPVVNQYLVLSREYVNDYFKENDSFDVMGQTCATMLAAYIGMKVVSSVQEEGGLMNYVSKRAVRLVKMLPGTANLIKAENEKIVKKIEAMVITEEQRKERKFLTIPQKGVDQNEILALLKGWSEKEDHIWKSGKVSGGIYHGGQDFVQFLVQAYQYYAVSNPLHPDVFPYVRKMEAEVVRMVLNLFHGDENAVGSMTSGGTESIIMACKTYREMAKQRGINKPQIIACVSAHAAFDKAADYLGFKLVHVPCDPVSFKIDIKAVKSKINSNTIALVGSAVTFAQGVIDDIESLSKLAVKYKLGLHVDSCLGSLLIPYLEKAGYSHPIADFRLPGVTSISCDTHKYGYSVKGTSVIMYRSKDIMHHQYFIAPQWTGGIYASPSMPGSRPGGLIASTWAAMVAMGEDGYIKCAKAIMSAAREIEAGIRAMEGVKVLGKPDMSVISFTNDDSTIGKQAGIYKIGEAMGKRGWILNTLQRPSSLHICVTYVHRDLAQTFLKDLQDSINEVVQNPDRFKNGTAAIYGLAENIPDGSIISDMVTGFLDCLTKA